MNAINFQAKYAGKTTVRSKMPNNTYENCNVSFVEITNTENDKHVFEDLYNTWPARDSRLESIMIDYFWDNNENKSLYLLTTQDAEFENLSAKNVLGAAEITKNGDTYKLENLQVRPDCAYSAKKHLRPFKGVGEAIMNEIIKLTKGAAIYVYSVNSAIKFYEKLGFKIIQECTHEVLMKFVKHR